MGLVVPIWIWLPVILWILLRRERQIRMMLQRRVEVQHERGLDMLGRVLMEPRQQLLASEMIEKRKGPPMAAGIMEMRNIIIVAVFGLLSAVMYAREPAPVVEAPQGAAMASQMDIPHRDTTQVIPPGATIPVAPPAVGMQYPSTMPMPGQMPPPPPVVAGAAPGTLGGPAVAMPQVAPQPRDPNFNNAPNIRFGPNPMMPPR